MATDMFERLPEEKKNRILQEALEEFATQGHDAASTNTIVKKAGISKGSLFKYFSSKDDLYLYTATHVLTKIIPRIKENLAHMPSDILERVRALSVAVIDIYVDNPVYYRFFMGILDSGAVHLQMELLKRNAELFTYMDLFSGADTSRFRHSPDSVFLLIKWLFTGIKQELFELQGVKTDPVALKEGFATRLDTVLAALAYGIYHPAK